jgi:uncharacterized membrane protein YidH (DUF202 family)
MPSWIISLLLAIGVTTWAYTKLAKANGNAEPRSNFLLAAAGGAIVFIVVFTLLKLVLNF